MSTKVAQCIWTGLVVNLRLHRLNVRDKEVNSFCPNAELSTGTEEGFPHLGWTTLQVKVRRQSK